jgi:uncharacterized protein (DUF1330 family)
MRQNAKAPATLLAGFAVGAGIIGALQAQGTKKPAYVIADVDITDLAAYQAYGAKVPPTLKAYNGRIIVRGKPSPKEGAPPPGDKFVMLEFDSLADAEKWYTSPEYRALIPERQKAAKAQIYMVEGLPQ